MLISYKGGLSLLIILFSSSCIVKEDIGSNCVDCKEIIIDNINELRLVYDIDQHSNRRFSCWPVENFEKKEQSVIELSVQDIRQIRFIVKPRLRNMKYMDIRSTIEILKMNSDIEKIALNSTKNIMYYNDEFYYVVSVKPNLFRCINRKAKKKRRRLYKKMMKQYK